MLPVIHIGGLTIDSFKLFIFLGFMEGSTVLFLRLWNREIALKERRYLLLALSFVFIGGLAGAQIHYFIFHPNLASIMDFPGDSSWHKALLIGTTIYLILMKIKGITPLTALDFLAPAIPLGHAVGRIGCFLAGDACYGIPTDLPWGMTFPQGAAPTYIPVHPVPLYESVVLLIIFIVLWKFRNRFHAPGLLFAMFTIMVGTERILLEELRLNSPIFLGLTEPQLIFGILILTGLSIILYHRFHIKTKS